jgi:hypothetical protein
MSEEKKSIQKPWAIYGLVTKFIGRVSSDHDGFVNLLYSEGQLFLPQSWSFRHVHRFDNYQEAIDFLLRQYGGYSRRQLTEQVLDDFPKAVRQESLQHIHNLLSVYAQSQPKLTEQEDFIEQHCCPHY